MTSRTDVTIHPPEETQEPALAERPGLLDRPLVAGLRLNAWHGALLALVVFLFLTRLWDLGSRGYSHDESIHAWEAWKLVTGQGYRHNPVYHGPLLYHVTALVFALFGHTDVTARLATALVGVAIALTPLLFRRWLGKWGTLAAIALMAISPVLMFRSRFIRHDHMAILANVVLVYAIVRYLAERRERERVLAAAALSLSLAGKETSFITVFILGTFLFLYWALHWVRDRSLSWRAMAALPAMDLMVVIGTLILPFAAAFPISLFGGNPVDYQTGLVWKGAVVLGLVGVGAAIGALWNWRRWLLCAGVFWGLFIPLFTSLFANPVEGIATGVVGQLGYWLSQHGVARGNQPWYYYFFTMSLYEYLPILVGAGGVVYYLRRGEPDAPAQSDAPPTAPRVPFVPLLIYWVAVAFAAYSWAGEKMPWLNMHLATPLHLLAGWALGRLARADWGAIRRRRGLWLLFLGPAALYLLARALTNTPSSSTTVAAQQAWIGYLITVLALAIVAALAWRLLGRLARGDAWRMVGLSAVALLGVLTLRTALRASFTNANYATEFLVYAHGTPDTALVSRELEAMSRRLTGGLHMRVAYDDKSSWPFEWYLRNFDQRQFIGATAGAPFDAEVVLLGTDNEAANRGLLGNRYYRREYRLIWWPHQDFYFGQSPSRILSDLRDPVRRAEILDVLLRREYPRPVTDWYLVSKFAMYVRRDIAQQLWDAGPEAIGFGEPLPGDEYLERWEERPATTTLGGGLLTSPKDVAVDAEGNLYVSDTGNKRIVKYDPQGRVLAVVGGAGSEEGRFQEPVGLAVGPDGHLYVADTWNQRIQVLTPSLEYVRGWPVYAWAGASVVNKPYLAVRPDGHVLASDPEGYRLLEFDAEGALVAAWGQFGADLAGMNLPTGLAADAEGTLYVADSENHRVLVFAPQGDG